MALVLSPPNPATDILPSLLNRYLSPKSPCRDWLVPRQEETGLGVDTSHSLRSVDIAHAYTTTCTAIDGPEHTPNDLRVMHRMDDGFALGSAAALEDKLLPYSKDPIVGSMQWANMKWRRFATDLKIEPRCEYVEVGEMENGRMVITVFVIQEGVDGALGMNADVLYYNDGDTLSKSYTGRAIVENADMRVSLRGLEKEAKVCRYCVTRGILHDCLCPEPMRKRCGAVPSFVDINPEKARGGQNSESSSQSVVAHGSSGLTLWDKFLERQRTLDRVTTVTYTVYQKNEPIWVGPFHLRLVYGKTTDTKRMAPVYLQRTTRNFRWARVAPARILDQGARQEKRESPRISSMPKKNDTPRAESPLRLEGFSSTEEISSMCIFPENGERRQFDDSFDILSSLAPHPVSLVTNSGVQDSVRDGGGGRRHYGRSRNGSKRFTCSACGSSLASKNHLLRHQRSVHERRPALRCDYCDREFREESHRAHHMAVVHTDRRRTDGAGESDFRCLQCGFAFVRKYTLLRHIKLVHERHRIKCPVCGRQFGQRCDLKRHVLRVHNGDGLEGIAKAELVRANVAMASGQ